MTGTVVVLAKAFPPVLGGVETYSEQVVRAYLRAGCGVVVLTQTEGNSGWGTRSTPDGAFRLWNAGPGGQVTVFRRMLREACSAAKACDGVIGVHSTTWRVGVVADMVFRTVPRVVTVHGREVLNFPPGARPLMRRVFRRAATVLAVSAETRAVALAAVRPKDSARWQVAHNGLTDALRAENSMRTAHDGPVRLLSLCRLVARKNVRNAVEAVASLDEAVRKSIDFRIAGKGPEVETIQHTIDRNGLGGQVRMLGFMADEEVPDLYDWADIFVHPHSHEGADFEGFGIAIADAMAHGCAVIAGRDGGPRDFVFDGETGFLVDGDDVHSIADAIRRMVVDNETRGRIASKGREHALANFSWDLHVGPAVAAFSRGGRNR
ncbi:glycosyltransferase family 4 protein [Nocardioides sp. DS6]|uniref:Glycosyltransferase family 4 protein n=1 Tax=Nocardioides eburneus TaxID=3231482 RepID=A0ABV3SVB1_9ACTN